jgi:RNA polymerase sigma-70 factor (ECF subfamily)
VGLNQLYSLDFVNRLGVKKVALLSAYYVVDTLVGAVGKVQQEYLGDKAIEFSDIPDRPNGGKWYASGACLPADYDLTKGDRSKHNISGRLQVFLNDYMGKKYVSLYDYDTQLGYTHSAYENFKYKLKQPEDLLKLLFGIYTNNTGSVEPRYLELIPELEEIGFIASNNKKAEVDIPVLSGDEFKQMKDISDSVIIEVLQSTKAALFELFEKGRLEIPQRINAPEYQKLALSAPILPMEFIYTAMGKGLFLKDIKHKCPAVVMIIGDEI